MNRIVVTGNLTRDAELTETSTGKSRLSLSVAVGRRWQREGEQVTDFFNCIWWGEITKKIGGYMKKGKKVLVEGEMLSRKFEDSKGNERQVWEIIVSNVELLSKNESNDQKQEPEEKPEYRGSESRQRQESEKTMGFDDDDDIPF